MEGLRDFQNCALCCHLYSFTCRTLAFNFSLRLSDFLGPKYFSDEKV
jgi:hypothetical protein